MTVIDTYLKSVNGSDAAELDRIRQIVLKTVPNVEEVISYGMPGFKYKGKYLMGMNAFKDHISIFPTSGPVDSMKGKLGKYKISKGTIQFTVENPLPDQLIVQILKLRMTAIEN